MNNFEVGDKVSVGSDYPGVLQMTGTVFNIDRSDLVGVHLDCDPFGAKWWYTPKELTIIT